MTEVRVWQPCGRLKPPANQDSPSTTSTFMSNVDRSRDSNSPRAVRVEATNRREIAERLVEVATEGNPAH